MLPLTKFTVVDYLVGRGLLGEGEQVGVTQLSGGYINTVFRVHRDGADDLVVKQSLDESQRTVLKADIARAAVEVRAMRVLKEVVGPDCPTPLVLDADEQQHVVVMTAAPADALLYDDEILGGRVPAGVGQQIGRYAATLHERTSRAPGLAMAFRHNPGFRLRDQSIRSAVARNPDLQVVVEAALQLNLNEAQSLVDSDITPKNVLIHGGTITKLDFECAQWGHPALDVGIVLAHYMLHAITAPPIAVELLTEAVSFFGTYAHQRATATSPEFLRATADYAAVMMLGRADGDLVFDYLIPLREEVNVGARGLLAAPMAEPGDLYAALATVCLARTAVLAPRRADGAARRAPSLVGPSEAG